MKLINVTCGIIEMDNKILVVQRSEQMKQPLKWEFPGGKIESFESEEECILREIHEELNIQVEIIIKLTTATFHYSEISIQLIPFIVKYVKGEIILKEHSQYSLLDKNELNQLDWAEADIPILNEYLKL